jgi:hypothetical protein
VPTAREGGRWRRHGVGEQGSPPTCDGARISWQARPGYTHIRTFAEIRARLSARTIKIFNVISRRFGSAARSVVVAPKWFVGKEETINAAGVAAREPH